MQGLQDLAKSERGVFCLTLLVIVSALVILGKLTGADWISYTKWIAITLVASKTMTGAIETITTGSAPQAPPTASA